MFNPTWCEKMKKSIILVVFLVATLTGQHTFAQSCAQTLRLARSTYEQGRLHELPALLEKCLNSSEFTKQERVEAYKILTLAYIYLEEPDKADETMLKILQTDNYFEVNNQVDPAEFIALYKTFRTTPTFRIGGKAGIAITKPSLSGAQWANEGTSSYKQGVGFTGGISAEIPLTKTRFVLNPELFILLPSYSLTNVRTFESIGDFETTMDVSQSYASLPLSVQYSLLNRKSKLNPYVSGGFTTDFLLSASKTAVRRLVENQSVDSKTYTSKKDFENINLSLHASAGIKYRFAGGFLLAEVRYRYGLLNVNTAASAFQTTEAAWNYRTIEGIYSLNALQVTLGYVQNIFKPKKLKVKP